MTKARDLSQVPNASLGFKNRLINSDMRIDQRNAGASVTVTTSTGYAIDRWGVGASVSSKYSVQQSSTAPNGFVNSALITSLSAYSVGASEQFTFSQRIEGYNIADLGWGTANAQPITISFWVRSSLTGTFGGALRNRTFDRSYPFTYTINSANTFEYKTITIAGDTAGSWSVNNETGIVLFFGLGVGTTFSGTAGAWAGTNYLSATGATSVVGTNGATFYITGVMLEKGSTATNYDVRPYGTELALCQRYYEEVFSFSPAGTTYIRENVYFKQTKRATPTGYVYAKSPSGSGTNSVNKVYQATGEPTATVDNNNTASIRLVLNPGFTSNIDIFGRITVDAEL